MSTLYFSKYHGAGNDFILIDDRDQLFNPNIVPKLSSRRFGIGADGVILLQKSTDADFRMRIFNQDGSEAESCGNGLRCLMQFIVDLGFPKKETRIAINDKIVIGSFIKDEISINLGKSGPIQKQTFNEMDLYIVNTGVPHAVLFSSNFESALKIRQEFEANVNFVTLSKDSLKVRTFERGVEAETLACGTGASAVAVVAKQVHQIESPIQISFPGGEIKIEIINDQIYMIGNAVKVFDGIVKK